MTGTGLITVAVALLAVVLAWRLFVVQARFNGQVQAAVTRWQRNELAQLREELATSIKREAAMAMMEWKAQYTAGVRQDAVQRSQAVTTGKVLEQLVPWLPDFVFNPKDARFLGSPVDFVVFDGLEDGDVRRVVFVEVKTGGSGLSTRERRIREAVQAGRVEWHDLRVPDRPAAGGPTGR